MSFSSASYRSGQRSTLGGRKGKTHLDLEDEVGDEMIIRWITKLGQGLETIQSRHLPRFPLKLIVQDLEVDIFYTVCGPSFGNIKSNRRDE